MEALDARAAWIFLIVWSVLVLAHGLWRSRTGAPQLPVRPSGPLDLV